MKICFLFIDFLEIAIDESEFSVAMINTLLHFHVTVMTH